MSAMDEFFKTHQQQAFLYCRYQGLPTEDAYDVLQDAMLKCFKRYSDKSETEWPALFFTTVKFTMIDFKRKAKLKQTLFFWQTHSDETNLDDVLNYQNLQILVGIEDELVAQQLMERFYTVVRELSEQQREVLLLRALNGLSEKDTAQVLNISVGSVKTQLHRAKTTILNELGVANDNAA